MSVLHITCKHWLGHVTVRKAGVETTVAFLSSEIRNDIALNLPAGAYIVRQSEVAGKTSTDYSAMLSEDSVLTLEIAWKNSSIATIADQEKVQYDGVSAGLHYAFGIKHGNCFLGDVRHELPLLDSIVLGVDIAFLVSSCAIKASGDELEVVFSKDAYRGTSFTATSLNLDTTSSTDIQLTYISGEGTNTWLFSIARIIQTSEVVNFDFNGLSDCIIDNSNTSLSEVYGLAVSNNSTQSFSDIVYWAGFEGSLVGSVYTGTENDYPANSTAIAGTGASLNTGTKRIGFKSLRVVSSIKGGGVVFTLSPALSEASGRVGFWSYTGLS